MKGRDQKVATPMTGGVPDGMGGNPTTAPNSLPPKNQNRTAARLQIAAEMNSHFGFGKNETNIKESLQQRGDRRNSAVPHETCLRRKCQRRRLEKPMPMPSSARSGIQIFFC